MELTAQQILDLLRAGPRPTYDFERNGKTRSTFLQHGAARLTVTVAGFKLLVLHYGTTLVSISPTARSAGRGEVCIYPYGEDHWVSGGYWSDQCARPRTGAAVDIAYCAWLAAGGNIDAFYKALGKRGFCAICGATLTDEVSMARGIGPECYKHIGVGMAAVVDVKRHQAAIA